MEKDIDATIALTLGNEVIETTAEHPFYTQSGWKDAADLTLEDQIKTKSGNWQRIEATNFLYTKKKVYNFEVADWHTYFVGTWDWLVHNNGQKCLSELFESALKNADKWKNWTKAARAELNAALKIGGTGLHAHHLIPLELLKKNKIIQAAYKNGFKFNDVLNGKALDAYKHLFTNGKFYPNHNSYTKLVESYVTKAAKKYPDMLPEKLLSEKVLPKVTKFMDEADKLGSTINDLAKIKGF